MELFKDTAIHGKNWRQDPEEPNIDEWRSSLETWWLWEPNFDEWRSSVEPCEDQILMT